ncbi:MAG: polysaccharide deacetylase family protein [Burkholderiales bacterium]|nr:polysaccharide deacetylase family protein [Burkholderiales bacterium]
MAMLSERPIFPPAPLATAPAKRLALKVDVQTYRGTREGVPRLMQALRRHGAQGTFLFSLGNDQTGPRLLRTALADRRRIDGRTLLGHYGLKTLMYGTVLIGPDIGRRCADIMRAVRDAGFEVGIQAWNNARWRAAAARSDAYWTSRHMKRAADRFEQIFGTRARVYGAAGWQMNTHAYRLTQRLGFDYCSDTRGLHPFVPVVNAELIACPQIPTTLPPLTELLARGGMSTDNAVAVLLKATRTLPALAGHVYTLSAEFEGMKLLPLFERVLHAWRADGMQLLSLGSYLTAAGSATLPRHRVENGCMNECTGPVALQGDEFLA